MAVRQTSTGRFRGTTRNLDEAARELRQRMTPAEKVLWQRLRDHRLEDFGFRRQHPFGSFVVDFACPSRRLAVEIDGSIHERQSEQDAARTEILEEWGWQVLRFSNDDVVQDINGVIARILSALRVRPLSAGHRSSDDC
jgi:very-short-patch-repair endonuclease